MGNEMGNTNVSSLERENSEFEAPNKSSEVVIDTYHDTNIESEKKPVSHNEEGFHEKQKDMISENPSGRDDTHTGKEVSDKRDDNEEQAPDKSSGGSLTSNERYNMTEQLSTSKDELVDEIALGSAENPEETSENRIPDIREPEIAEVQAPDGPTKPHLVSTDTNNEPTQSALTSGDGSFHQKDAPNKNLSEHSSGGFQEQIPTGTGHEPEFPARNSETQLVPNLKNDEGAQSVVSSLDGMFCEADSVSDYNFLKPSYGQVQKQMPIGTEKETETVELQAPIGSTETQLESKDTNKEGTQSVLSSYKETVHEADSAYDKNLVKPSSGSIQKQMPVETELETAEFHAPDGSTETQLVSNNKNDEGTQSVISSEEGRFHEVDSASENKLLKLSDGQIEEQAVGTEPESTEVQDPVESTEHGPVSENTNNEGTQSALTIEDGSFIEKESTSSKTLLKPSGVQIQEQVSVETGADASSIILVAKDQKDEEIQSVSSPEEGCLDENASACNGSTLETGDHQVYTHRMDKKEGEKLLNSSSDTKSTLLNSFIDLSSDQLKPDNLEDMNTPGLSGTCSAEENQKQSDNGSKHMLAESAFLAKNSAVDMHSNGMKMVETEAQEETLLDLSNINEKIFNMDRKGDSELECVPVTRSPESFQDPKLQSDDKFVVLTYGTSMFEIASGMEQMKQNLTLVSTSEESEEPMVDKRKMYSSEYKMGGVDGGDDNEEMVVDKVKKYIIKTDTRTSEQNLVVDDNGHHVALYDKNTSSVYINDMGLENETELRSEVSAFPVESLMVESIFDETEFPACTLSSSVEEVVTEKGDLHNRLAEDVQEIEVTKPVSFALDLTEPDTTCTVTSVKLQSKHAKQSLTAMATEMLENRRSSNFELKQEGYIEVDVGITSNFPAAISAEETPMALETLRISSVKSQRRDQMCNPGDSTSVNDSNMNCGSPDSNESYKTAYEQENLSPTVNARTKFSFDLGNQIAEIVVVEMPPEPMIKTDEGTVLATSDVQAKPGVGRLPSEAYSADLNIQAEVSRDERSEVLKEIPLECEEKTVSSESFRLDCNGSEVYASKVGVKTESPGTETEVSALLQENKENSVEKPPQNQISEKEIITMGRNSSERSNTPLLSFLKEESNFVASQRKQESLASKKKTIENRWNFHDKKTKGIPPQGGVKRKAKPLLFNICMCCTTEIQ